MVAILSPEQKIIWQPQEGPQTALLQCPVFEVFYGGARGGGKTESSIGDWLQHSSLYGEAATGVFFRRTFKQLEEVVARTQALFPKLGAKYNKQDATWTMANGARLKFRYIERDADAEEYQGHSYTRIYVEELTNFPSAGPINKLRATLRSPTGVPCGMRLTGNPGGPGHNWVKARYIDPAPEGYKIIAEETEVDLDGKKLVVKLERVFIPSKLQDNLMLLRSDPTYVLRLRQSGSEQLVKAWLNGDWNIIDGAFFDEFDYSVHVLSSDWTKHFPKRATRFRSFDWGSAKPFSVGWWIVSDGTWGLPAGAMVRYREWYGAKAPNEGLKMTAEAVAAGIVNREQGEHINYGVADPAIFIRNGGPSIAETMAVHKCQWRPGDNKRKPGWEQCRSALVGLDGKPLVYVLETCDDFIRTIPVLQHDESDPEDLDTDGEDHAADEWRYAEMSRASPLKALAAKGTGLPKLPSELTINQLIARQKRRRVAQDRAGIE